MHWGSIAFVQRRTCRHLHTYRSRSLHTCWEQWFIVDSRMYQRIGLPILNALCEYGRILGFQGPCMCLVSISGSERTVSPRA